ncbi:MAG: hypothetical protein PHH71_03365 [Clostridia bacterium]|nr:hypothetical protein [Clostridia bacterium]MDD4408905.1 hypothetical protein [Clostridia bacterium]
MKKIKQFIYPAIFVKVEDQVSVNFPDLGITTDGESYEEAFLFAKDFLRVYCTYALKCDYEINMPSIYEDIDETNVFDRVMLIDAVIFPQDLKAKI